MATAESNSANGAMLSPEATMIEVASGEFVDVLNPDPESLHIGDIAQGLSMTCRYGGHIKRFYSVAEHSVLVHDLLAERGAGPATLRLALFHDAAEAYLGDIVAPLKYALRSAEFDYPGAIHRASNLRAFKGAYAHLSDRMDRAIAERFELGGGVGGDVQLADMWALRIEAAELTASGGANWRWPGALPLDGRLPEGVVWHGGLDPENAAAHWLGAVAGLAPVVRGDH